MSNLNTVFAGACLLGGICAFIQAVRVFNQRADIIERRLEETPDGVIGRVYYADGSAVERTLVIAYGMRADTHERWFTWRPGADGEPEEWPPRSRLQNSP